MKHKIHFTLVFFFCTFLSQTSFAKYFVTCNKDSNMIRISSFSENFSGPNTKKTWSIEIIKLPADAFEIMPEYSMFAEVQGDKIVFTHKRKIDRLYYGAAKYEFGPFGQHSEDVQPKLDVFAQGVRGDYELLKSYECSESYED